MHHGCKTSRANSANHNVLCQNARRGWLAGRCGECDFHQHLVSHLSANHQRLKTAKDYLHRFNSGGRKTLATGGQQRSKNINGAGGNAPFLVFEDADIDAAVTGAMQAKMRNIGQACTAANRFIVHDSVADEFATKFAAKMGELNLGRGIADGTTCGPVINLAAQESMQKLVDQTLKEGADLVTGGEISGDKGYFFKPTVLTNVPADASILREEIFGPVAPIVRFKSEQEAIRLANDTEYGLVSYAFTQDLQRGMRLVNQLDTGMSGINTGLVSNAAAPFGGVKQSGLGREGGFEGLEEYLETRYVLIPNS